MKIEKQLIENARGLYVRYTPVFSPGVMGSGEIRFPFWECEVGADRAQHDKVVAAAMANAQATLRLYAAENDPLTAAAPAMFAALEHVAALADDANFSEACAHLPELETAVENARAALARAQGKVYTYETAPDDYSEGEAQP